MPASRRYGTIAQDDPAPSEVDAERAAMLNEPSHKNAFAVRCAEHLDVNVSRSWGDVALLGCYLISGLLDSSSIIVWGSFSSMQTGNTVYLGLGIIAPDEGDRWIRALISIVCFCLGSLFFSTFHRHFSPRKRWVMVSSFFIQMTMILIVALMTTLGPEVVRDSPLTSWIGWSIGLISFQSAGQAVTSRVLNYSGLTSVVLTSVYCDLFSDPNLLKFEFKNHVERNRRLTAPILLFGGAMIGGVFAHSSIGLQGALWTAVALKAVVVVAWSIWAPERDDEF